MDKPYNPATTDPAPPELKSTTRQAGWRRANPLKYSAHMVVQRALSSGRLQKQLCEVCGVGTVCCNQFEMSGAPQSRTVPVTHDGSAAGQGGDLKYRSPDRLRGPAAPHAISGSMAP